MKRKIVFSNELPPNGSGRDIMVGDIISFQIQDDLTLMSLRDKDGKRGNFYSCASYGSRDDKLIVSALVSNCNQAFELAVVIASLQGLHVKIVEESETLARYEFA